MRVIKWCDAKAWVAEFEKPKGDPAAYQKPATTVLSPYLKVSSSVMKLPIGPTN